MQKKQIEEIVFSVIHEFCNDNGISVEELSLDTPLIGSNKLLTSMGLVNVIVDIETALLDEDIEVSLTSETAMSSRISPFRSVGALCNFIARQLNVEES